MKSKRSIPLIIYFSVYAQYILTVALSKTRFCQCLCPINYLLGASRYWDSDKLSRITKGCRRSRFQASAISLYNKTTTQSEVSIKVIWGERNYNHIHRGGKHNQKYSLPEEESTIKSIHKGGGTGKQNQN